MINIFSRKNNKACINFVIYQRKLSGELPRDENTEISKSLTADKIVSRNKSGLLTQHRNVLHNRTPYKEPNSWIHLTEKYQRKIFGRYGLKSGVNPKICYSIKSDKLSYEQFAESETIQSMINKYKLQQQAKIDEIMKREEEISKKLEKLSQWKQELNAKICKKEADAIAAKEKKDRLVEEVRRYFGYKIDPKDERFKEVLEQKEREDRKKQKEEKRKAKEQKLISKLVEKSATT